jgi:phage terminase large subunit GpA-like protein
VSATAIVLRRMFAASIAKFCIVPEPLTVTEWADRYRVLPETSTAPGPYRSSVTPYARRPQNLTADPDVPLLVLCWASQTTKSTIIENALGYKIHRQPAPLMVLRPKIDDAEGWSKERFVPMVLDTPVLRERVKLGRSSGATLRYKPFPGGFIFVASAQSATEMASRSAPDGLADEVDRMEIIPKEGNPLEIFKRRQAASDVGQLMVTSTPRDAETTLIWPYLEGGTFELYEVPCPECSHMQPLEWARLRWSKGKPEEARYFCRACEAAIDERNKPAMLAAGEWKPTNPDGKYPSFHLNALYSPFGKTSWAVLAEEWERAQGKPADLQVFINTRLAELWTETAEIAEPDSLIARASEGLWEENVVPDGVGLLTIGVDVQANRLEAYVWGWGVGLESWLIAHTLIPGDPQREPDLPGSVWRQLDQFLSQPFRHESGAALKIRAGLIDSGFATSQVYRYTRTRKHLRIFASKGVGHEGIKVLGKPTLQGKDRIVLYPIGVNEAKREFLRSQILESSEGPGYVHLPHWITTDQCAQLVAEKRVRRVHRGRVSYEWMKKTPDTPNEALDCRIYARAALEQLGAATIAHLATYVEHLRAEGIKAAAVNEQPPADPEQEPPPPPRRKPRDSFVKMTGKWSR